MSLARRFEYCPGGLALAIAIALSACATTASAQVYRCKSGGKVQYQQSPCEATGGTGGELKIPSSATRSLPPSPVKPVESPPPDAAPSSPPQPPAPSFQAAEPKKTHLETQAEMCLNWYRHFLRDPRGAYYRDASKEKGVLRLVIYATNGYGGYVQRSAACEFKGRQLDQDWTTIHAKRAGWSAH